MLHNTFTCDANPNIKNLTRADPAVNIFDNFTLNKCKLRMQNRLHYNINYSLKATEHLGNVLATVSDVKIQNSSGGVTLDFYTADILNSQDYYAFEMLMPGKIFSNGRYRFGHNRQEPVNELTGINGSHYTALTREYDARLGRRWNLEPKLQISISDYGCFGDNPIYLVGPLGDEIVTSKERYKTLKNGTEKKTSNFSLRKADRIEITHTVISVKMYDKTGKVKNEKMQTATAEIQNEIESYWNTANKEGADADGYISNGCGQKIKVTAIFASNIEVVTNAASIGEKDHLIVVESDDWMFNYEKKLK